MLSSVFALELSKQKRMFFSAAFVILFTIALVALRQLLMNQDLKESLSNWITVLLVGGVPLVATIFGIAAAMGIRKEPGRSAEEVFPIPPFTRVAGSYFTSFLLLIGIGVPLLLLGLSMGSLLVFGDYGIDRDIVMAATAVIYFQLLTFVLYYWFKDIFLAVVVAGLVMFAHNQLMQFLTIISYWFSYAELTSDFAGKVFLLDSTTSIFAVLLGLFFLARNIERGIRITVSKGIFLCLLILSGLVISTGFALYTANVVRTRLVPDPGFWRRWFPDARQLGNGFLVTTINGSKIRLNQNGERQVLYRSTDSDLSWDREVHSILMNNGSAWVIANADQKSVDEYVLLFAPPDKPVQEVSHFQSKQVAPRYFYLRGAELALKSYPDSKGAFYTPIPFSGTEPNWQPVGEGDLFEENESVLIQQGVYAVLSKDRKRLTQTLPNGVTKEWILPGTGQPPSNHAPNSVAPAFGSGEQISFVLPVVQGASAQLIMCKPDGAVVKLWDTRLEVENPSNEVSRFARVRWKPIPGGSAWLIPTTKEFFSPPKKVLFQDSTGVIYPPLDIRSVYSQIGIQPKETENFDFRTFDVRRATGSTLFVLLEGTPAEVDLQSGKVLKHYKRIVRDENDFSNISRLSTNEGIYFISDGQIQLLSWQGTVRNLGPAKLE